MPDSAVRSRIPQNIGRISIVLGAATALSNLPTLLISGAAPTADGAISAEMVEAARKILPYQVIEASLMIFMSLVLVYVALGLIKYREPARKAAIQWSMGAFVVVGIRAWIHETKIWPYLQEITRTEMQHFMEKQGGKLPPVDMAGLTTAIIHASQYFSLAVLALFPTLLLILMNRDSVKNSMLEQPPA